MTIRRLTDDERELAGSVWDTYRPFVENVARQHLRDQADSIPDVVQNVGLIVCTRIGAFRGAGGLRSWIYRVTMHEARRVRRQEGRHGRIVDALTLEPAHQHPKNPHERLEQTRTIQTVREALDTLKPSHREILRQDLDAGGLYTSENAAWCLRYRARNELRARLTQTERKGRCSSQATRQRDHS